MNLNQLYFIEHNSALEILQNGVCVCVRVCTQSAIHSKWGQISAFLGNIHFIVELHTIYFYDRDKNAMGSKEYIL